MLGWWHEKPALSNIHGINEIFVKIRLKKAFNINIISESLIDSADKYSYHHRQIDSFPGSDAIYTQRGSDSSRGMLK